MGNQPEALRLADALEDASIASSAFKHTIAAELRRLHAVNQELLEALKEVGPILARMYGPQAETLPPMQRVRAAIAKAEGNP